MAVIAASSKKTNDAREARQADARGAAQDAAEKVIRQKLGIEGGRVVFTPFAWAGRGSVDFTVFDPTRQRAIEGAYRRGRIAIRHAASPWTESDGSTRNLRIDAIRNSADTPTALKWALHLPELQELVAAQPDGQLLLHEEPCAHAPSGGPSMLPNDRGDRFEVSEGSHRITLHASPTGQLELRHDMRFPVVMVNDRLRTRSQATEWTSPARTIAFSWPALRKVPASRVSALMPELTPDRIAGDVERLLHITRSYSV